MLLLIHLLSYFDVPPTTSKTSSRTYDNYISSIRKYFKPSFSKKKHYKELEGWIKNELLPTNGSYSEVLGQLMKLK
ncbi:hypothetical protein BWO97_04470 [Legionella pneumophila subsp. pneumophila ATCC 43290]|nr:hypothetical protein lp12_2068 [Legionella pneumophila subsp. pneumophila ATCC 43290]OOD07280.1 hypothetical protein BWO97_04470 [Legionella pneumophila subsp. pneumophila ATCC 43290]